MSEQIVKLTDPQDILQQADSLFAFHGFTELVGIKHKTISEGYAELVIDISQRHLNRANVIHGGVLASLLDITCGQAGLYCPYKGRMRKAVTLSLTTTFTGQANQGRITAIGKLRSAGRRIFNSTGEIYDEHGKLLAMGEGTFQVRSTSIEPHGEPI